MLVSRIKNIKELEIDNKYRIEIFKKVKTKFDTFILRRLEEYEVHLPTRFVSELDDKIIKDVNKNNNLILVYKGLKYLRLIQFAMVELKTN